VKPAPRPRRGWLAIGGIVLAWLVIDRPWTIRPIEFVASGPFDANAYVTTIWERARADVAEKAIDVRAVAASPPADPSIRARAVSIAGTVLRVDTTSRVGMAMVDATPGDGRADASVQIGPVLRGSALRDALSFVRFTDFPNQIAFAAVASALNDRVVEQVLRAVDVASLTGRRVRVMGAVPAGATELQAMPVIVPVAIDLEAVQ
jgi:predicted lipoprotein